MASSTTANNNVEVVDFVPKVFGTYRIEVKRVSLLSSRDTFGLAWW
ncbi:MAG: hypothetical protein ACOX88_02220 [Christensenellales bacterium]